MSREALFAAFFFAAFLLLLYALYLFVSAYSGPLVWAAILALTFYPINDWLVRRAGIRRSLAATALVFVVTIVAILPSFYLGSVLVGEATGAYNRLQEALRAGAAPGIADWIRTSYPGGFYERLTGLLDRYSIDLSDMALRGTQVISAYIAGQAASIARDALISVLNFLLMLVALWFFFRDGEAMAQGIRDLIPMEPEHKDTIFQRLYDNVYLLLIAGIVVMAAVYTGWGLWEILTLPPATLP